MREHLDEGALQAYLDAELESGEREAASRHLEACAGCREELDALKRLGPAVRQALEAADPQPPHPGAILWEIRRRRAAGRARAHRRRTAAVASLIVLLGAGLASAAPGSPIRDWWESRGAPTAVEPATLAGERAVEEAIEVRVLPAGGEILVSIHAMPPGSSLEIAIADAERAVVSAPAGVRFETGEGRVRVDAEGVAAGAIRVDLPGNARSEVRVDGRTYAIVADGELGQPGLEPFGSVDGVLRFEIPDLDENPTVEGTSGPDDG